jgi:hypothetical protein
MTTIGQWQSREDDDDGEDRETLEQAKERTREEWKERLAAVLKGRQPMMLHLDVFAFHDAYTQLVDPEGEEGCCAGCARLPFGWCVNCDMQLTREKLKR